MVNYFELARVDLRNSKFGHNLELLDRKECAELNNCRSIGTTISEFIQFPFNVDFKNEISIPYSHITYIKQLAKLPHLNKINSSVKLTSDKRIFITDN